MICDLSELYDKYEERLRREHPLVRTREGYMLRKGVEEELKDPEPKPEFCSDREIFPQNDQEFEELWHHHFAPRFAAQ